MPRDSLKWRVNEAVQDSALPPPSRLVMLVLSDMADSATGEIPAKKTPSVTELARRTGLTETTVKTHRAALERLGWIVILRPSAAEAARHVPSRYRIAIGQGPAGGQEATPGGGCETTPATDSRGSGGDPRNVDRGSGDDPAGGQETTTAGVRRRPPSYYYDRNDQYDQVLGADAPSGETAGALFGADTEGVETTPANKPGAKPKRTKKPEPQRDDVDALCTRLVKLMVERGCREPSITEKWREQARLLLDKDRIDGKPIALSSALALLEWSQQDEFWSTNVMSIPTFRTQYDKLRKKALAEWKRAHPWAVPRDENEIDLTPTGERNSPSPDGFGGAVIPGQYGGNVTPLRPRPSTTDQRVRAGLELAAYYRERGE